MQSHPNSWQLFVLTWNRAASQVIFQAWVSLRSSLETQGTLPSQSLWISPPKLWQHLYCQGRPCNSQQTLKLSAFPLKVCLKYCLEVVSYSVPRGSSVPQKSGICLMSLCFHPHKSISTGLFCQHLAWFCWIVFKIFYNRVPRIFVACRQ